MNSVASIPSVLRAPGQLVRRRLPWVAAVSAAALLAWPAGAVTRNVGMVQTYPTITAALAASSDGDVINVVDPTHTEADIQVSVAVTIQGQGASATVVQAQPLPGISDSRVFSVSTSGSVVIRDMTIRHGNATSDGGGISLGGGGLILDHVVVTLNQATGDPGVQVAGGGVYAATGRLRIRDSVISFNIAQGGPIGINGWGGNAYGGGVAVFSSDIAEILNSTIADNQALGGNGVIEGYGAALGGGICQWSGTLNLSTSVVRGNQAVGGTVSSGFGGPAEGGGVWGGSSATVHVVNSTISSNQAYAGQGATSSQAFGGGIKLHTGSLSHCTVAANQTLNASTMLGAGLYSGGFPDQGPLLTSSVFADNVCSGAPSQADLQGHVVSGDYNIVENNGGTFTGETSHDKIGVDPLLVPLGDWGGPTSTHPLSAGSEAIDMVPVGTNGCRQGGLDQRAYLRAGGALAGGAACDSGAFEAASSDAGLLLLDGFEAGDTWMWSATAS